MNDWSTSGQLLNLLTVIAVAPILILGIWLISSEGFATLVAAQKARLREYQKVGKRRRFHLAISERSHLGDIFLILAALALLSGVGFALSWKLARGPLIFGIALAVALLLTHSQGKRRATKRTLEEVDRELPQFIQALCLLVSAGLSPIKSLEIISRGSRTTLGRTLDTCLKEIHTGKSISEALDLLAARLGTSGVRRFVTTLLVATERGAPLVPILVALVRDTQSEQRTQMLRQAGRTEIALMIPVVFLLLPISVLFALFPSIQQLQLFAA